MFWGDLMKLSINTCKSAVVWLTAAHCICDIYGGFINPLMPFIASKLGFTMALATVIVAITQICSNMLQPVFGFFADNILHRFFIFWGLILASVFIPLAASAPNVLLLVIFMILGCMGGSFFHPQSLGFISVFSDKNYHSNMGVFVCLGSAGFAIGPLLAAYITQFIGLEKVVYTSTIGLLCAFTMFLFVPKLSEYEKQPERKNFFASFKEILSDKQMDYLILVAMMKSLVTNSTCILLPFLWKSMGYTPFYIGFALFLFVFAGAIGSLVSPYIEKHLGSKNIIYFSMWATFPLMVIFALTYKTMPVFSMCMFGMIGFTTMLAQPVTLVWAQKILPKYKSIVSGFINGFCWGSIALLLTGLGAVAQKFGIMNVLLVLTFIPAIASYYVKYLKEE